MSRKLQKTPSFFKVLSAMDFSHLLRLPPYFLQKYGSILPAKNVKLRISSGRTWDVMVKKMDDGLFCFTQGWENFARDVGLKLGEFLVFMFDGEFIFDVSVYETSACEKEFPATSFQVEDSDRDEDDVELIKDESKIKNHNAHDVIKKRRLRARNDGSGTSKFDRSSKGSNPLYFEILLKLHHRARVVLSKKFLMEAGLMGEKTVRLEYIANRHYQSVVISSKTHSRSSHLSRGWHEFRRTNGLVYGKTYSFEFKPSKNVIHVKEVKRPN